VRTGTAHGNDESARRLEPITCRDGRCLSRKERPLAGMLHALASDAHARRREHASAVRGVPPHRTIGPPYGGAVLRTIRAAVPGTACVGRADHGSGTAILRGSRTNGTCRRRAGSTSRAGAPHLHRQLPQPHGLAPRLLRRRHYSYRTECTYVDWARRFLTHVAAEQHAPRPRVDGEAVRNTRCATASPHTSS
jgi:hypothetical protein